MDKKPILLVLALALVLVLYVGFMASAPQVTPSPTAQGEVRLEVTGPAAVSTSTDGQVTLVVV